MYVHIGQNMCRTPGTDIRQKGSKARNDNDSQYETGQKRALRLPQETVY